MSAPSNSAELRPGERDDFLQRAARSVAEVQPSIDNIGDAMVFLEVLGYTDKVAIQHGFEDLFDMAKHVYAFTDYYAGTRPVAPLLQVPSSKRRATEALSLAFPWIGSWSMLIVFGVSLWLSGTLSPEVTTAFLFGVLLGLMVAQGHFHAFNRLFAFYYGQSNISEARRVLRRNYGFLTVSLAVILGLVSAVGLSAGIPSQLILITIFGATTLSFHLASYIMIYTLKKVRVIFLSYAAAFNTLVVSYSLAANLIPDVTERYLTSLGLGLVALSVAPLWYHYRLFTSGSLDKVKLEVPSFYRPVFTSKRTIASRFSIQLWENIPYLLFGTLYLSMLFGDRILSWLYNPKLTAGNIILPFLFNTPYHLGADLALLVLLPTMMIQYNLMSSIYEELHNLSVNCRVTETDKIDRFLRLRYFKLVQDSFLSTLISATVIVFAGPTIIALFGGSQVSAFILDVAVIANIFMSIFTANTLFLIFANRVKWLVIISGAGAFSLWVVGAALASYGFQNIVFAYLTSSILVATLSLICIRSVIGKTSSIHFSKYV